MEEEPGGKILGDHTGPTARSQSRESRVAPRCIGLVGAIFCPSTVETGGTAVAWTTPTLVEICIGLEINGYLPAEF
jgi:coenzyme PQQ precursor peptide PqqA